MQQSLAAALMIVCAIIATSAYISHRADKTGPLPALLLLIVIELWAQSMELTWWATYRWTLARWMQAHWIGQSIPMIKIVFSIGFIWIGRAYISRPARAVGQWVRGLLR